MPQLSDCQSTIRHDTSQLSRNKTNSVMKTASKTVDSCSTMAVIPATGRSHRMGECKALLRVGDTTLITLAIRRMEQAGLTDIFVTVCEDNHELAAEIRKTASATLVLAEQRPPDMLASIRLAIRHIEPLRNPAETDCVFVLPSDHPCCRPESLKSLRHRFLNSGRDAVIRPRYRNQRGHPILMPWRICTRLNRIPPEHGLNWMFAQADVATVDVSLDDSDVTADLNTPEAFRNWLSGRIP